MKVNVFLTSFKTKIKHMQDINTDEIIDIITDLVKPTIYLSYDDKLKIISKTLKETDNLEFPSAHRHRLFILNLISAYTNLECKISDFDLLCENELLDIIISLFEREYKICNSLMQMCLYDHERNK